MTHGEEPESRKQPLQLDAKSNGSQPRVGDSVVFDPVVSDKESNNPLSINSSIDNSPNKLSTFKINKEVRDVLTEIDNLDLGRNPFEFHRLFEQATTPID